MLAIIMSLLNEYLFKSVMKRLYIVFWWIYCICIYDSI